MTVGTSVYKSLGAAENAAKRAIKAGFKVVIFPRQSLYLVEVST